MRSLPLLNIIFVCAFIPALALACPYREGMPDTNCDGKIILSFFGDSVTRGVQDPQLSSSSGGVQIRLKKYFKQTLGLSKKTYRSINFGHSGVKCLNLKIEMRQHILNNTKNVAHSDITTIACGLNDFFTHKNPQLTAVYLKSMKRFAKKHGIFATVAMVTQTKRPWQQPWVKAVNDKIFNFAKRIRYDLIKPNKMISSDLIHPNGAGYDFMYQTYFDYLFGPNFITFAHNQLKLVDDDVDGLYDSFELSKFGTDPTLTDTDGDGYTDGEEVFDFSTDPLSNASFPTPEPTPTPEESPSPSPTP